VSISSAVLFLAVGVFLLARALSGGNASNGG
jgi:hypothetical protein